MVLVVVVVVVVAQGLRQQAYSIQYVLQFQFTYAMVNAFGHHIALKSITVHHSFSDDIVSVTNLRKDLPAMLTRVRNGVPVTIMQGDQADLVIVKRADLAAMAGEAEALRARIADLSP